MEKETVKNERDTRIANRYFISSLKGDIEQVSRAVRGHWSIESMHWYLDVTFREDATWNFRKITTFLHRVQQFLFKAMNRRGCRRAYTWNGCVEMLKYYTLAKPKTYYCLY